MVWLLLGLALLWCVTRFYLRGEDLRAYDIPVGEQFDLGEASRAAREEAASALSEGLGSVQKTSGKERLRLMRAYMDGISDSQDINAQISPIDAGGIPAEWVLAPGVNPARRVLYIHGGAFMMGSPKSHRNITSNFSRVANAAVLAIDYRLMPENSRMAGVEDCRVAYRWILENGPDGTSPAERIYVSGDSAGGNLTLALSAWVRDEGIRAADAVVALSPITDATFNAPSLSENLESDAMLGPMFSKFMRLPNALVLWVGWAQNRTRPSDSVISPVFGDLSGLPPTLVHTSDTEILRDDARRYVNKAVAAGSYARLQSWNNMPHVWQMFYPQLPEACAAWGEIESFLVEVESPTKMHKIAEKVAA